MHTGYYMEEELIQLDDSGSYNYKDSDFSFMSILNIFTEEQLDMYKYLHGYCDDLACALSDTFGYRISSIWSQNNKLIHAFCVKLVDDKYYFIDARGITDDWNEFIDEFRDEYNDDLYDEPVCTIIENKTADEFIDMCVIDKGKSWDAVNNPEISAELGSIIKSKVFNKEYNVNRFLRSRIESLEK